jgi:hypothetical protein
VRTTDLQELHVALREAGLTASRILPVALAAPAVASHAGMHDALVAERERSGLFLDVVGNGILRFSRVAPQGSDLPIEARRTLTAAHAEEAPLLSVGTNAQAGEISSAVSTLDCLHETPPFHLASAEDRGREIKRRSDARTRLAILMTLSAVLLVLLVWVNRQTAQAVVTRGQGAWAREFVIQQSILDSESGQAAQADAARDVLHQALHPTQPLSDLSAVAAAAVPSGGWRTGITVKRGKPLQIRGTAKTSGDVARLVYGLSSNPRFRDVKLVFANSAAVGKIPVIQFDISAECVGNLPLPAPSALDAGNGGDS